MLNQVKAYIKAHDMIRTGDRLIVAVSGGPDSMALLDILYRLREEWKLTLIAAHLHHGLRPEADAEQTLVEQRCESYGVKLFVKQERVRELAQTKSLSLEDAGRRLRYSFFEELRREHEARMIATAHHSDDLAETVLLHLLRGSGVRGLRGILPVNGSIIRPLLSCRRQELLIYLSEQSISYAEDNSNLDLAYTRNRIRHELLPLLRERYNPSIEDSLNRLADIAAEDESWMERLSQESIPAVIRDQGEKQIEIDLVILRGMEPALQRRILHALLKQLIAGDWGYREVNKLIELSAKRGSSHRLHLQRGVEACLIYDTLVLRLKTENPSIAFYQELPGPGRIMLEDGRCWELSRVACQDWQGEDGVLALDDNRVCWPLCLRSRRPGDRFLVPGMNGSKKVKDIFMEMKIPQAQRDGIPLLASVNGEIYALPKRGSSRIALPNQTTSHLLLIRTIHGEVFTR